MKFKEEDRVFCDVLIIGGGGAGLKAAIEAREMGADVLIVSKTRVGFTNNTYIAKASIAATGWGDFRDNPNVHFKDTVAGGRFINDQDLVSAMTKEAENQISFLEKCGVDFTKQDGRFQLGHVAGHSYPRHIRGKNRTGSDIVLPLKKYAKKIGVKFADRIFISRLFTSGNRVVAAAGISEAGAYHVFSAKCIILATGGYAQVYQNTNNAAGITGDGHILAFDLGVSLMDIEFIQFYPTAVGKLGNRIFLYEVFILNAGALLINAQKENIIEKHGLSKPVSLTRDKLARAIMMEIVEGRGVNGGVIMDISRIPEEIIKPLRYLLPAGRSNNKKKFIVSPTAHFCMGGVIINKNTETSVDCLFAAGEICAGIHGANRLGGNALCEVFAMGGIGGKKAAEKAKQTDSCKIPEHEVADEKMRLESLFNLSGSNPKEMCRSLKEVMWLSAGILRHKKELDEALNQIEELKSISCNPLITKAGELISYLEFKNMLLLSEMVCRSALLRTESRGAHYRSDYPDEDNTNWLKNIIIQRDNSRINLECIDSHPGTVRP